MQPLLAGACDDDDNELTEAQKKIIEERLKALQARFKEFEEKTLKQKVDELVLANEGLTEAEAEMTLKVCNGNEFEASDRLSNEDEDHEQFRRAIRRMVLDEQRSAHLGQRARAKLEERLAKKRKRLARRRDQYADSEDEDVSDWEESDWEEEPEDDEPLQEVRFGVHFVRHKKTHKVGGRLRLDDALGQLAAAQAAAEAAKKKAEEDGAAGVAAEGGAAAAEGTAAVGGDGVPDGVVSDGVVSDGAASPEAAAAPAPAVAFNLEDLMEGWSDARKRRGATAKEREPVLLPVQRPRRGTGRGQVVRGGARPVPEDAGGCAQRRRGVPHVPVGILLQEHPRARRVPVLQLLPLAHQERRG